MANQRGGSVGRFVQPAPRGRVSDAVPGVPLDDGTLGRQVASTFGSLARELGDLADRAAIREATDAGTAAGMAAGGRTTTDPAPAAASARPSGTGGALKAAYRGGEGGLDGVDPDFAGRLDAFLAENPGVTITSAFRTPERQAELYRKAVAEHGSEAAARKWVAPPGRSKHNHGIAADLAFASPEARQRAHASAARFGLHFPLSNEAWHIEPAGSRDSAAAPSSGLPAAPPEAPRPLALRRDATLAGDAYDAAARRAFGYRLDADLRADIAAATDVNRDDPAGLSRALDEVRGRYLAAGSFNDPALAALLDQRFADMSWTARQSVAANHDRRRAEEARVAGAETLSALELDLSRQARAIGANPDGDTVLGRLLDRGAAQIDTLVQDRVLTPEAAVRAKAGLRQSVIAERVAGTYEALPDDAARDRFSEGLLAAWDKGEGAVASLPRDVVEGVVSRAARDRAARTRAAGAARAGWEQALDDDLASVAATGEPVAYQGQPLSEARIADALGPEKAAAWAGRRRQASAIHAAAADLDTLPEAGIAERLRTLEPKAGSPGFADAEALHGAVSRRAAAIMQQRRDDPAAAVDGAFEALGTLKAALDPARPETFRALASARLRLQDQLGIPGLAQQPLTNTEARALALEAIKAPDGKEGPAWEDIGRTVTMRYGEHADAVMAQLFHVQGVDTDSARRGAAVFRRLTGGDRVPRQDARAADVSVDAAAAERGLSGTPPSGVQWRQMPNMEQIRKLQAEPQLADAFDAKFGAGAAAFYLTPQTSPGAGSDGR